MMSALLLLWAGLLLLSIPALVIAGIVTLIMKDEKRLLAFDVVLGISTFMIALFIVGSFVPPDAMPKPKNKGAAQAAKEPSSEYNVTLLEEEYLDRADERWKSWFKFVSKTDYKTVLKEAEDDLLKQVEQNPKSVVLASELGLVFAAEKKNPEDAFKSFHESLKSKAKKSSGSGDEISIPDFTPAAETLLVNPQRDATSIYNYDKLTRILPKRGWYEEQVNSKVNELRGGRDLADFRAKQDKAANLFIFKCEAICIAYAVLCAIGVPWLIYLLKPIDLPPMIPITTSFRRMYVCLLSILFGQCLSGFVLGIVFAIYLAMNHITGGLAPYNVMVTIISSVIGIATFALSYYFAIAKPLSFGFFKAYNFAAQKLTRMQTFLYCLGGFGVAVLGSQTAYVISRHLFNIGTATTTGQKDLAAAIFDGNFLIIVLYTFFSSVIAPVSEELLLRGLFYSWLRTRFNILVSALISSSVFAIFHFNPNGFLYYLSLGCILCLVYERTRNLWICVVIHALWNTLVIAVMWCGSP
ncbi:MAG TPA: type II CAAX endopeptidase family protein [Drouetiella sp.]